MNDNLKNKTMEETLHEQDDKKHAAFSRLNHDRELFISGGEGCILEGLTKSLEAGKLPSEYVNEHLGWLFKGLIPEAFRDELNARLDGCMDRPYTVGWLRRPMRSENRAVYAVKIQHMIRAATEDATLCFSLKDILEDNIPDILKEKRKWSQVSHFLDERVASALDLKDPGFDAFIEDFLMGDRQTPCIWAVIRGVFMSHRSDMHEKVGKMLLAARLQEGLRQTICESMDDGTFEAFMTLLEVIDDNNLIRYSSVKRAVGTWLGIISEESSDLDRIGNKSVPFMVKCLTDEAYREACLSGEDSMAIYIALWSVGTLSIENALSRASRFAIQGSRHQRLVSGYFMQNLGSNILMHQISKQIIRRFPDEWDTLAIYMPGFLPNGAHMLSDGIRTINWNAEGGRKITFDFDHRAKRVAQLSEYFESPEEAHTFYDLLNGLRKSIGKKQVFSPCVFPWHSAILQKSDVAERMCVIAGLLQEDDLLDQASVLLSECSADERYRVIQGCFIPPNTPIQREMVLNAQCDKAEFTREAALQYVENMELEREDYLKLEALLRYKYADARPKIIDRIMKQPDDRLYDSIGRLISDKSEEKRMAALDMVKRLLSDESRKSTGKQALERLKGYVPATTKEKAVYESLFIDDTDETLDLLYDASDRYVPIAENTSALYEAAKTFMRYFPGSRIPEALGMEGFLVGESFAGMAAEDCKSLIALYEEHGEDPVEWLGEKTILRNAADVCIFGNDALILDEVWMAWYENRIVDPARLLRACICMNGVDKSWSEMLDAAYGNGFAANTQYSVRRQLKSIIDNLVTRCVPEKDAEDLGILMIAWMARRVEDEKMWIESTHLPQSIDAYSQFAPLTHRVSYAENSHFETLFSHALKLQERIAAAFIEVGKKTRIKW